MGNVVLNDWLAPQAENIVVRAAGRAASQSYSRMRTIRGRYDAATTDVHNERHWALADGMSARQANSPGVREKLRNRARYEVANNCYARGIVNTLADVEIGYGAVLHIPRPSDASAITRSAIKETERLFEDWAAETQLWEKLWTARIAKAQDGEGCGVFRTNPNLESMVQLDLQLIESEQLSHGTLIDGLDPKQVDGVEVDNFGYVQTYMVLPEHPGDALTLSQDPIRVPARQFVHWYRCDRPGMLRGLPEIMPALPLFSQLRRLTLASLTAAETAADLVAVIKSNLVPEYGEGDLDADDAMNLVDMHRGMFMELPDGREIQQLKSEHPSTTYEMFKREILCEVGRCLNMPRAIALADASGYNYASGRLDRQAFDRYVETARWQCEQTVLRKIWAAWWYEASRIPGYLPAGAVEAIEGRRVRWFWRVLGHVDRAKEETGRGLALANGTTTLADECGREGVYWEDALEQRALELQRMRELGIQSAAPASMGSGTGQGGNDGSGEEADDEEGAMEDERDEART